MQKFVCLCVQKISFPREVTVELYSGLFLEKHAYDSSDCNIACAVMKYCYNALTFRVSQCGAALRAREDPRQTTEEVSKICLSNLQIGSKTCKLQGIC